MNISILDVLGPVMVGPSSSHTAGALKLARSAMQLAAAPFHEVEFALHGSFLKTGSGHGTDRALLAGVMGLPETDEGIRDAFRLANERGLAYRFVPIELPDAHENSCRIRFFHENGAATTVTGSSIGGGLIRISEVDGIATDITATCPTLVVRQRDRKGIVGAVSNLIAEYGINIAVMRLSRTGRGGDAIAVLETDSVIPDTLCDEIAALPHILSVRAIH